MDDRQDAGEYPSGQCHVCQGTQEGSETLQGI